MEFSLLSYSQKRILAAGVLSLLSGYVLGVTNIPRAVLLNFLSSSWMKWSMHVHGFQITSNCINFESFIMVLINCSLFFGASIGSIASVFVEKYFGKVKGILSAYFLFGIGSIFCLNKDLVIFLIGRVLCGAGVGFSCNLVPSYIFELTNKQNQTLFSTLHNVLFCCGILLSYLLSIWTMYIAVYIVKLRSSIKSINETDQMIANIYHDSVSPIIQSNLGKSKKTSIELSITDLSYSVLSIRILFIIPMIFSLILSLIWILKLNADTPSHYIKLNDIRAAEETARQIYGTFDTTRIISQLREENKKESISIFKLFKAISKSPMRNVFIFIPILICTEVFTGYIPLVMNSKLIISHFGIIDQVSSNYIVLTGCFLVNFTLSGVFFELYIGSKRLYILGLILCNESTFYNFACLLIRIIRTWCSPYYMEACIYLHDNSVLFFSYALYVCVILDCRNALNYFI
ncbi:Sugar (and other) transporter family protein [Cryptosporidium meleagridis]|uniref:Hexose transporter 1 n=1 Tax=Cryptosporidium meleagridis TaxID=93969 RepID=A0A2P4Z0V4_9CRYT|nr:Sugar (and other) transporter family protein [Cryptosporidium meleagridis]